ncbi:unnamed protein product [marine sediment metagenome]|uniref:Uncharacterized protein n=1 Tax=marine sediment metagenome TaxID=412755 RepID=X1EIS0_9ZZZZ
MSQDNMNEHVEELRKWLPVPLSIFMLVAALLDSSEGIVFAGLFILCYLFGFALYDMKDAPPPEDYRVN